MDQCGKVGHLCIGSGWFVAFISWLRFDCFERIWSCLISAPMVCVNLSCERREAYLLHLSGKLIVSITWNDVARKLPKIPSNSEEAASSLWEHYDLVRPVSMPVHNVDLFWIMTVWTAKFSWEKFLGLLDRFMTPILEQCWAWYWLRQRVYYYKMP